MATCPDCSREVQGEFSFCPFCGAELGSGSPAGATEERKVVSVLFCDLAGFTAASEAADPEDVKARLRPYHERTSAEIDRYGGTVEKFIGDAVMAVFGAPTAHEDDAERAVRAGLAVLEAIDELNASDPVLGLQVRIGINTGEALVALNAHPGHGQGMATGDVVNTAARLQTIAPVNGIAVGEATHRATERVFLYERLDAVRVKGKQDELEVFRPTAARARFGADVTRTHGTPLVGRDLEKRLLIDTFERAAAQRSCQLVTVVGEPGVGKSRLCSELLQNVADRSDLIVTWRQGRCLPYGDGIAFWALGEIVKAQCGILESDSQDEAWTKLGIAIAPDDPDRDWLLVRLAPLVGARYDAPADQEESFGAWRRFCESLAADHPAVLCFEDLHWADEALCDFLEHLADWSDGVPLVLLCTARPELLERRSSWAAGLRNATTINLSPLSEDETARLISELISATVLPDEVQRVLLERAGGNPLYAEEFVRLLGDRELQAGTLEDTAFPDSVHALIAARLDTLTADQKRLLQDASVIGKVFWAGALASMGERDPRQVEVDLHELVRRQLVRTSRTSSMAGEAEYGFWHILVRDVCYAQIPRAAKAAKHRAAADWLERMTGARLEDAADVIAHHYTAALELTRAAGADDPLLAQRARPVLRAGGYRAMALAAYPAAGRFYTAALELCPLDDAERPDLLLALGRARFAADGSGLELMQQAQVLFGRLGNLEGAADAASAIANLMWFRGDRPGACALIDEAIASLADRPASLVKANALLVRGGFHLTATEWPETETLAREALAIAEQLGLGAKHARALNLIGWARIALGDRAGLEDLERAVVVLDEAKSFEHVHSTFENLRSAQVVLGLIEEASATTAELVKRAGRLPEPDRRWSEVLVSVDAYMTGDWDASLRSADAFLDVVEQGSPHYIEP
ncbi:MAG TPA: adenylate/guanylate cyclase domain-containing protein, partial [Gaiellales bacterium]|nr:adenylate/guanylate cyclase domain-containing protein [Gaiellales bacterium]